MKKIKLNQYGISLIETVISLWILGIIVLSVMAVGVSNFAKRNQSELEAISLIKSEYQSCLDSIQNRCILPVERVSLISLNTFKKEKNSTPEIPKFKKLVIEHRDKTDNIYIDDEDLSFINVNGTQMLFAKSAKDSGITYDYVNNICLNIQSNANELPKEIIKNFQDLETTTNNCLNNKNSSEIFEGSRLYILHTEFFKHEHEEVNTVRIDNSTQIIRGNTIRIKITAIYMTSESNYGEAKKLSRIIQEADITVSSDLPTNEIKFIEKQNV